MFSEIDDIHIFLGEFSKSYGNFNEKLKDFKSLEGTKVYKTECLYVLDFALNQMSFKKGFQEFLGDDDSEMNLEMYLEKIHPDDIELVTKIGKASILHSSDNPGNNGDNVLYITFRLRNHQGEYVKVLSRSSVFQTDQKGNMISALVIVSDLSFMEPSEVVNYKFVASNLDPGEFKNKIFENSNTLFTSRELDVIRELNNGFSNPEIGEILGISAHTVATHRKKIMNKSDSHSREALLLYCRKNGVIQ